jgi:hypothetical protein
MLTVVTWNVENFFAPQPADQAGLSEVEQAVTPPAALSPVEVADDGTTLARMSRGALAVTYAAAGGTRSGHSARI